MAGLNPSTLLKVRDAKSTLTTPTAEGVKGTAAAVAVGAAKGAVTGGGVLGAVKGAVFAFAKTKAGRRVIMVLLCIIALNIVTGPFVIMLGVNSVVSASAFGGDFRSGQSAVAAGQDQAAISDAMATAAKYRIPWQLYLALSTVQDKTTIDPQKLSDNLGQVGVRTIATAGVYVSGRGLVEGTSDREKGLADTEKTAVLAALAAYGLDEPTASKVYAMALKWAYGDKEECTPSETSPANPSTPAADGSPIVLPDGTSVTLTEVQLGNAQKIITAASKLPKMTPDALTIALMAAITESGLKLYANSSVPESLNYPHDAVGSDHDSVGFWQMRQHWGTTAELMTVDYQTKAFFGGPDGPNHGSPAGLWDITGWEQMTKGEAAQAVEVSAFPDRYQQQEPLAKALLTRFGTGTSFCDGGNGISGKAFHPVGDPNIPISDGFGPRASPGGIGSTNHRGLDFSAGCDHPIYAIADGTVTHSGPEGSWGNSVVIDHGNGLVTRYAHQPDGATRAAEGDTVKAGQQIGITGTTGASTGCHLHFETIINDVYTDPAKILTDMGVQLTWQ